MLSLIVVFGIVVPLMIWALMPSSGRKRRGRSYRSVVQTDAAVPVPAVGPDSLPFGSSCDSGGAGSCDGS